MAAPDPPEAGGSDPVVLGLRIVVGALACAAAAAVVWAGARVPVAALLRPWYLSRAAGVIAYLLLWASVVLGLLQSTGALKGVSRAMANVEVHDYVSMAALYATLFHALILIFDEPRYAYTISEVLVPFAPGHHPALVGAGILGLYLCLIASVSTYVRVMSPAVWRAIHLSSLAGFALALVHGLLLGSDSATAFATWMYWLTGASTLALVIWRIAWHKRNQLAAAPR